MSVRKSIVVVLMIGMVTLASRMARADDGAPSRAVLQEMGLGGMTVMSEDEAASIRGQGYKGGSSVHVAGRSYARINLGPFQSGDSDDYHADGRYEAKGKSFSVAGIVITSSGGYSGGGYERNGSGYQSSKVRTTSIIVFAGGYSSAKAF